MGFLEESSVPEGGLVSAGGGGCADDEVIDEVDFEEDLVQSLNLGPIWQASDSLSPRAPGSARRPFLKFAPEPSWRPSSTEVKQACHPQLSSEIGVRSSTLRIVFAIAMA